MSSVQTIEVHTAPAYEVTIGAGLLRECGARLKTVLGGCRIVVAADSNVAPLYLETVCASLRDAGFAVCSYVFPAGEAHKNFTTLSAVLEFLAESQLTRTDCVAALGGGVTGDMAGFAAASYLRGIRYVQLPTTLLSAVDSSVGGKTAIDLAAGKNLAGAFLQPAAVLCDTDCLGSLPAAVFADGAAEAIKTGVLSGETLFSLFEDGMLTDAPAEIIARCIRYKAGVVERDEKEQGERRKLNLGHTVGHAIEKCSGYAIPHGHAVAAGLAVMARASERLGWAEPGVSARIAACLEKNGLPTGTDYPAEALAKAALADKKRSSSYAVKLARMLGVDAVVISEEGFGNPDADLIMNCRKSEQAGIKTVLITDEYAGRDGSSQSLADSCPEGDACVTAGNANEIIVLPPMDKVIGDQAPAETIAGGFFGSVREDGSLEVELQAILGATNELGFNRIGGRTL